MLLVSSSWVCCCAWDLSPAVGSHTSVTVSHILSAEIPSNLRPASRETISASVLLCETAVYLFEVQLIGANVLLIWSLSGHPQSQRPGKDLTCILMQCFPHDILFVTTCDMDVGSQSGQAFITASWTETLSQPRTHQPRARSRAVHSVPWVKECSDVRVISFPPMRLTRASVYLRIGAVGRERFRPANNVRNCVGLPTCPLPLPRARGRAEESWLECCLGQNGDDRCINRAQSFNRWVIGVYSTNTTRPITPRRTNNQTHKHQRRENRLERGTRTRSVNTFVFRGGWTPQRSQRFSPFGDSSCQIIHTRQNIRPADAFKVQVVQDDLLRPVGSQDKLYKLENFGWLVGGCRDRPSRALPLTCPNVKNSKNEEKRQKKKEKKKKRK